MEQKLHWHSEKRKVDSLLPHGKSPRKISKDQLERLKKSLEQFNLVEIPAINADGTILAGHQRIKVLQILGRGDESIDVRVPNRQLEPNEAERYLLSSNAIHADWDFDLLKDFDIDLLLDLGFDQKELDDIWNIKPEQEEFDLDKEKEKIKVPKTKPGDFIELGPHRLICGDSTKPETGDK
jgi:ParB-like chromosome segregation protein Spo0J